MAAWSLRHSLVVLAAATVVTALVAETLVHTLESFAEEAGLTEFFVAAVIVAIVGNAAEHGGAVVVAYRGNIKLAAEIALASSAQVAVFLIPAVALISWLIEPLALSFRQVEILAMGGSVLFTAALLFRGHSTRWRGAVLIAAYVRRGVRVLRGRRPRRVVAARRRGSDNPTFGLALATLFAGWPALEAWRRPRPAGGP